jgi:hypothetical protein
MSTRAFPEQPDLSDTGGGMHERGPGRLHAEEDLFPRDEGIGELAQVAQPQPETR